MSAIDQNQKRHNQQHHETLLNTKWNVEILEPREVIGGQCLPKDMKMFLQSSKSFRSEILTAALEVDQEYTRYKALQLGRT